MSAQDHINPDNAPSRAHGASNIERRQRDQRESQSSLSFAKGPAAGVDEFDDAAGVSYTVAKLRSELDELYRRESPKNAPKIRPGVLNDTGPSIIGRLQQIDHLQRYQIAALEYQLAKALNPPKHKFWGAGEPDCPREIKAGNGELHTLRCKVCGLDDPRDDRCLSLEPAAPVEDGEWPDARLIFHLREVEKGAVPLRIAQGKAANRLERLASQPPAADALVSALLAQAAELLRDPDCTMTARIVVAGNISAALAKLQGGGENA